MLMLHLATMYRYRSFISKLNFLFEGRQVHTRKYCRDFKFAISPCQQSQLRNRHYKLADHVRRFSVASEAHRDSFLQTDLLTFVKSTLHNPEGPNHCWLNGIGGSTKSNQDGMLLMLVISSIKDLEIVGDRQHVRGFQIAKLVQQRHPEVNVIIVCSCLLDTISDPAWIFKSVMEEFITFPILVLKKDFLQFPKIGQMSGHVGFLLFQGSTDHLVHLSEHNEIAVISKAIEEYSVHKDKNNLPVQLSIMDKTCYDNMIKEPYFSPFRILLLHYPGSISIDEDGNRMFVSDSNHHRIIVSDSKGKILDCVSRMVNLNLLNCFALLDHSIAPMKIAFSLWTLRTMR